MSPWIWSAIAILLLASAWGERVALRGEGRGRLPGTVALLLVIAGCLALTYAMWVALGPVAGRWIGRGGLVAVGGVAVLVITLLPVVGAGLAAFYVVMMPVIGLDARRTRTRVRAMRDAVRVAAVRDPRIQRVWLCDGHGGIECPPPPTDTLEIEADATPAIDLEDLRCAVDHLRPLRMRPLVVHVVPTNDPDKFEFDPSWGYLLFDRDDPAATAEVSALDP